MVRFSDIRVDWDVIKLLPGSYQSWSVLNLTFNVIHVPRAPGSANQRQAFDQINQSASRFVNTWPMRNKNGHRCYNPSFYLILHKLPLKLCLSLAFEAYSICENIGGKAEGEQNMCVVKSQGEILKTSLNIHLYHLIKVKRWKFLHFIQTFMKRRVEYWMK